MLARAPRETSPRFAAPPPPPTFSRTLSLSSLCQFSASSSVYDRLKHSGFPLPFATQSALVHSSGKDKKREHAGKYLELVLLPGRDHRIVLLLEPARGIRHPVLLHLFSSCPLSLFLLDLNLQSSERVKWGHVISADFRGSAVDACLPTRPRDTGSRRWAPGGSACNQPRGIHVRHTPRWEQNKTP